MGLSKGSWDPAQHGEQAGGWPGRLGGDCYYNLESVSWATLV